MPDRSPLPRDPEYWERLAERLREDAADPLLGYASWYGVLARRAPWLLAASTAAMLLLWLFLPMSHASMAWQWMERSISPGENAGAVLGGPEPPSVDELLAEFYPSLHEERPR